MRRAIIILSVLIALGAAPGAAPAAAAPAPSAAAAEFTPAHTWYFAEGYTGAGFDEYLCLGNMIATPAQVRVRFVMSDGTVQEELYAVAAKARLTVMVNQTVGPGREVSMIVETDGEVAAERPMYFLYRGVWSGGHNVLSMAAPSNTWYFAEGYTGSGFDMYLCALNPQEADVSVNLRFQTQEAGEKQAGPFVIPAHSRRSWLVDDVLKGSFQTSVALTSTGPVVCERSMYFDYTGGEGRHWEGGHCVMGATALARTFYFAEGTTRDGFEEWLTLQNPGAAAITVRAVYQLGEGQGPAVTRDYEVAGRTRRTVDVAAELGSGKDVSVTLSSAAGFLAERPMYFEYRGFGEAWQGGHCIIGATDTSENYFFAEGYTGDGFHEYLCIQNPGVEPATLLLSFYPQESRAFSIPQITVPGHSRRTIMVNTEAHQGYQMSCKVQLVSGGEVVVERPMYFDYRGWDGGHDVTGYPFCPV